MMMMTVMTTMMRASIDIFFAFHKWWKPIITNSDMMPEASLKYFSHMPSAPLQNC